MLVTAEELATAMARPPWTDLQKPAVEGILQALEDDLGSWLKRALVTTVVEDEKVEADRRGRVRLAATPVRSVEGFSIGDSVVDPASLDVASWGFTITPGLGMFWPTPLVVPSPVLLVSYTAGLPGEDAESEFGKKARSSIKRAAARDVAQMVLEKAHGVGRLSTEGTTMDFTTGGAGGWTEGELEAFRKWKRRVVRT